MQICIFEDSKYPNFEPLALSHPVYELLCGVNSIKEKIATLFPGADVSLFCRDYLTGTLKNSNPGIAVNELKNEPCILINGRVIEPEKLIKLLPAKIKEQKVFMNEDDIVAAVITGKHLEDLKKNPQLILKQDFLDDIPREKTDVNLVKFVWDLIRLNGDQIISDMEKIKSAGIKKLSKPKTEKYPGVHFLERKNIITAKGVIIKPGTVIDATGGPVFIDDFAEIFPNSVVEGPCYIGKSTKIKSCATIYKNVSVGDVCKIGGEVEASIIMPFTNKQHSGFLGHSYLGSWINLGADTNTSDLKNNYSTIKITLKEKLIDTSLQFLGLIMGDHSKTGINTMFNTGTIVGFSSNIFGSGFPPKYIPSFCWGGAESLTTYKLDKAVNTAKTVFKRREKIFTRDDETIFENIFNMTKDERERRGL